ncbi:ATP-binding protein [Parasphaerochaeta coccoides]|uniref:AAA ATPase central domain protein n=1 Tax=Parasphaerochaeta coccoides (strain ATCC BAA-1237 / DSM 17374 / SPN1) TaxID=760011 RepID=F4GLT3_PARC1|nr:ATP-binding protein [Parasphaerochaeta coccoides]AEC02477.1 AAA ATPase central domain protein [Parasphaerochaeta coccoides DSM 17374]
MKKKNIINLIKYYTERNDSAFRDEAYEVAVDFNRNNDHELGDYIMALLSDKNTFVPQALNGKMDYLRKVDTASSTLPLPECIKDDVMGIVNAVGYGAGVNKFLFQGAPGTGKTESAKQLARILNRQLYIVDFDFLVDSKLGQTSKNIAELFAEINNVPYPEQIIILFDEIDALALDRTSSRDLREMGRATSSVLKGLDGLNTRIVLIATTNLFDSFDKALIRRFDKVIDFNRYTQQDLREIAEIILEDLLQQFKFQGRNIRLFRKIIALMNPVPYPGDLKNIIKTAIAFSNPHEDFDYLSRLFRQTRPDFAGDYKDLQNMGFSIRDIEILSKVSKSSISRELMGDKK